MMRSARLVVILIATLSSAALLGCGALTVPLAQRAVKWGQAQTAPAPTQPTATASPEPIAPGAPVVQAIEGDVLAALEGTLEAVYEQVSPSVVFVEVIQRTGGQARLPNLPDLPGMPEMPFFQMPDDQSQAPLQQGSGSGFVWDTQGHIVTNNHVVDGAERIKVTFIDGTSLPAVVVGSDPDSDLAVLEVDLPADQLHPVQLADSAQVRVGQLAIAIGYPFGLDSTMTVGFVSGLGRTLPVASTNEAGLTYTIPDIIQTDAPINPGNSGGVLVNDRGQMIGVTTAIVSAVRSSAGVGFAVPSSIAQKVIPALILDGRYAHPWIGISGTTLQREVAEAMELAPSQRGALVIAVTPGSPAERAGLRSSEQQVEIDGQPYPAGGDLIVAIDDQPVQTFDDLVTYLIRSSEVGQRITLTVLRRGEPVEVEVTLEARPMS